VALCWSQDDKYLLSCSADGRARLFDASRKIKEPVLDFVRSVHNFKPKEGEPPNEPFAKDSLGHCQFYYMDKFILLAAKNSLRLYKYALDLSTNDLKRYAKKSRYKLVTSIGYAAAQSITALQAPNTFHSHI